MKKLLALAATLAVILGPVLVASPASSSAFPWRATITFDKLQKNQFDSKIVWRLYEKQGSGEKLVETHSWRAGSGLPGRGGENPCAWSRGWLPNGTYRLRQSDNYRGNAIHGRVFRLDNKNCGNGNVRHDLFLHSEQTVANGQCKDRRGDQNCRWEFPRINDYKSLGCIKMAPRDLAQLTYLFHEHFAAGVRYPADRVALVSTN